MGKPHKFQKEIIAWANGETIQYRKNYIIGMDGKEDVWHDMGSFMFEIEMLEFRIKPNLQYPTTTLTLKEIDEIFMDNGRGLEGCTSVANAAIRRYIDDQESKE